MPIAKPLTIENVNLDDDCEMDAFDSQVITAGIKRVRAEGDQLRREGLLDERGPNRQGTPGRHAGGLGTRLRRVAARPPHVHRRRAARRREIRCLTSPITYSTRMIVRRK